MKTQARNVYDNWFGENNVYGHSLELLTRNQPSFPQDALHLDIGCGFGRIAEPLSARTGLHYVGVDGFEAGLQSLAERGFEAHQLWLGGEEDSFERICGIVAGRPVASISFLDTLEHLADGDAVLRAIGRIAIKHSACVVVSTPNVAHGDVGRKLAFGLWDYTEAGLLDRTHLRLFNSKLFEAALKQAGLLIVDAYDVQLVKSDQNFPEEHPALATGTLLHGFLHDLRSRTDTYEYTNQFVRLCVAGPRVDVQTFTSEREGVRPFLTVVMRTQGTRLHTLVEALTGLAGQTNDDFEVVVLGHKLTVERQLAVERAIEDSPEWLRNRVRLALVENGNRTHPLNVGFEIAHGRYIAILDDDDIPMAHWVETFRQLHERHPGCILRAVAVRQDVKNASVAGMVGLRAEGPPDPIYSSHFDLLDHLVSNHTPGLSVAFPRGTFHYLKIRFDEDLSTTEDWDFLMRTAAIVGVASSPEITSIYRWWSIDESSRTVHPPKEWLKNHERILAKMDSTRFLLPINSAARIRSLLDPNRAGIPATPSTEVDPAAAQRMLDRYWNSTSWQVTGPFRTVARHFQGQPREIRPLVRSAAEADVLIRKIRRSFSWKLTAPIRWGGRLFSRHG